MSNDAPAPQEGWLDRQLKNAKYETDKWPRWKRKEAGILEQDAPAPVTAGELDESKTTPTPYDLKSLHKVWTDARQNYFNKRQSPNTAMMSNGGSRLRMQS